MGSAWCDSSWNNDPELSRPVPWRYGHSQRLADNDPLSNGIQTARLKSVLKFSSSYLSFAFNAIVSNARYTAMPLDQIQIPYKCALHHAMPCDAMPHSSNHQYINTATHHSDYPRLSSTTSPKLSQATSAHFTTTTYHATFAPKIAAGDPPPIPPIQFVKSSPSQQWHPLRQSLAFSSREQ